MITTQHQLIPRLNRKIYDLKLGLDVKGEHWIVYYQKVL
jgi:hypothetical protein